MKTTVKMAVLALCMVYVAVMMCVKLNVTLSTPSEMLYASALFGATVAGCYAFTMSVLPVITHIWKQTRRG